MRIEKVSENQIRCTLTREDLDKRHIKLSELAYGSENAKNLFRDMMQQASLEFGFEADDIPLMIEAIPLSSETIVLLITKVDSPEELDTRFSNFTNAPSESDDDERSEPEENPFEKDQRQEILDLFERIRREKELDATRESAPSDSTQSQPKESAAELVKMFQFSNLDTALQISQMLKDFYIGDNALYKDTRSKSYHLVIRQGSHSLSEFHKVYNVISEYSQSENYTPGSEAYFKEHCKTIIPAFALQALSEIG